MRSARSVNRAPNTTTEEDLARFAAYRADPTIEKRNDRVELHLPKDGEALFGEAVQRRLDAVGRAFRMPVVIV